jgi:hypothetical protein
MRVDPEAAGRSPRRGFSETERQAFKAHGVRGVKTAALGVMGSCEWRRLVELDDAGVRFTRRVGNYCARCGRPVLDALCGQPLSDYPIGLLMHAIHTNDGGETIRLITRLSERGRM